MRFAESFSSGLPFQSWLLRQAGRRDAVGVLARQARRDRRFLPTTSPEDLRDRFRQRDVGEGGLTALSEAEREWRRAARRAGGLADRREPDPRQALAIAVEGSGHSLAEFSRMLGRGSGYLARFVREGVPVALSARDHQALADYFGVDPRGLGIRDLWADRA